MKEFYQQTVKEVLDRVESRETGLTSEQAGKSRERCGWNELAEGKKKSIPQIFLEQYKDFLVLILIASAIISGMLGDEESAAVILIVITINAILGTVQTIKAEQWGHADFQPQDRRPRYCAMVPRSSFRQESWWLET